MNSGIINLLFVMAGHWLTLFSPSPVPPEVFPMPSALPMETAPQSVRLESGETEDWRVYRNDKYDFELKYPADIGSPVFQEPDLAEASLGSLVFSKDGHGIWKINIASREEIVAYSDRISALCSEDKFNCFETSYPGPGLWDIYYDAVSTRAIGEHDDCFLERYYQPFNGKCSIVDLNGRKVMRRDYKTPWSGFYRTYALLLDTKPQRLLWTDFSYDASQINLETSKLDLAARSIQVFSPGASHWPIYRSEIMGFEVRYPGYLTVQKEDTLGTATEVNFMKGDKVALSVWFGQHYSQELGRAYNLEEWRAINALTQNITYLERGDNIVEIFRSDLLPVEDFVKIMSSFKFINP
jgi:hypothetical protein